MVLDSSLRVSKQYGVKGLPMSFFVDADGKIREKVIGWMTEEKIEEIFKRIKS